LKISFKNLTHEPRDIEYESKNSSLIGTISKVNGHLCRLQAEISATIEKDCDTCGKSNSFLFKEDIEYLLANGIYDKPIKNDEIIIEFTEDIDLNYIITSELESVKCDYYKCEDCEKLN
jgi:hypothetical protein